MRSGVSMGKARGIGVAWRGSSRDNGSRLRSRRRPSWRSPRPFAGVTDLALRAARIWSVSAKRLLLRGAGARPCVVGGTPPVGIGAELDEDLAVVLADPPGGQGAARREERGCQCWSRSRWAAAALAWVRPQRRAGVLVESGAAKARSVSSLWRVRVRDLEAQRERRHIADRADLSRSTLSAEADRTIAVARLEQQRGPTRGKTTKTARP